MTHRKRFEDDPPYRHEHAPWDGPAVRRSEAGLRRFEDGNGNWSNIAMVLWFTAGCSLGLVFGALLWWWA